MGTTLRIAAAGAALLLGACGAEDTALVSQRDQDILSQNGLSVNGLSVNGLSVNGLSVNGLSVNGLNTGSFVNWFHQNPATAPTLLRYLARCALPAGKALDWRDPRSGTAYRWEGDLGLTPGWAGGQPATLVEQQLISACLAAHANKYGVQVQIAVEGLDATGKQIPITEGELTSYPVPEGCFFGNLFAGQGVFAGNQGDGFKDQMSSRRVCALASNPSTTHPAGACAPLAHIGRCESACTMDPTRTYYTKCTYNGTSFVPLTTRMHREDIFFCGDGICQPTESCGNGNTADSCKADCGPCH